MAAQDFDRFRSFAERYIVARAALFRTGFEREDAWKATLDAKTIYGNVARMSIDAEPLEVEIAKIAGQMNGAGNTPQVGSSVFSTGATGPMGPPGRAGGVVPKPPRAAGLLGPSSPSPVHHAAWVRGLVQKLMTKEGSNGTP